MNRFYQQPLYLQWGWALSLAILGFVPLFILLEGVVSWVWLPLVVPLYVPFLQFVMTPLFRLARVYHYYSPMLLGYLANSSHIDLHSGTSFDYLFVFCFGDRKGHRRQSVRNRIIRYQLEGLLAIVRKLELEEIPRTVVISGTTYFLGERSAQKLGFQSAPAPFALRINLIINFLDLLWMYSVSNGRFAVPAVWKPICVRTTGEDLLASKMTIERLLAGLERRGDVRQASAS